MKSEEETHTLSAFELLHLAENHLRLRNYSLSSQYALESLHSTSPYKADVDLRLRAQRIVAVSDVLSAASETLGPPYANSYSILGVDTFCADNNLIRSKLKSLLMLLEPVRSTFPPADEAMKFAWNAWNVLGNPDGKSELDGQVMAVLAGESRGVDESEGFWTFCPYCYFLYEYARVFEGYCLRCQNGGCRRMFQGVSIRIPSPIVSNQDWFFSCFGYFPLGFSHLEENARNGKKFACSPFVGVSSFPDEGMSVKRKRLDDDTGFVDISDDSEGSDHYQAECGIQGNGNIGVPTGPSMMDCNTATVNAEKLIQRGRVLQMNRSVGLSDAIGSEGVEYRDNFDVDEYGFVPEADDMQFVEKDGEIFLEVPPDDEDQ